MKRNTVSAMNVNTSLDLAAIFAQAVDDHRAGRLSEAVAGYVHVLALKPDLIAAHNNLGNALSQQG